MCCIDHVLQPGYYDVPLQPPTTLPTRDATGLAAAVPYTGLLYTGMYALHDHKKTMIF